MGLAKLIEISRKYGTDADFVLAGGGNTSYKTDDLLYIKPSGTTLANLTEESLVRMDRARLDAIWERSYSDDSDERERQVLADLMAARVEGQTKRPSVESLLHGLLRQRYVVHLHPALVNGLTCGRNGEAIAKELHPDGMAWIPVVNPGYVLARHIRDAIKSHLSAGNRYPDILLLQNHGVVVASDSIDEVERIYREMVARLSARLTRTPEVVPSAQEPSESLRAVAAVMDQANPGFHWKVIDNPEVRRIVALEETFAPFRSFGYTPDHLVYCKASPIWVPVNAVDDPVRRERLIRTQIERFEEEQGTKPRIVAVEGSGILAVGDTATVIESAAELFLDLVKVVVYAESFGGPMLMPQDKIDFILDWEAENYRAKVGRDEA